ncbi:hypothetical protein GCM10022224_082230 [Nonomuraea antimicrobica]|uniref:Uncharacterized protein n=1 Tax=Nonomuraea antimicrobica TaxID=561173 RepID=A0ABP7DDH1_9ACTN
MQIKRLVILAAVAVATLLTGTAIAHAPGANTPWGVNTPWG